MGNFYEPSNGHGPTDNGHLVFRQSNYQPSIKVSLPWLDVRVFYVRISKCEIDDSAPEFLAVNHIPLDPDTLLDVNGVRTSIHSDGATTLLRRDRLDKKSEETTFVSTDSVRMTGSVKFEVFDKDVVVLSGVLELCNSNGFIAETDHHAPRWSMNCESDIIAGSGFFKGKQFTGAEPASPSVEVYIAGSFSGTPIILTKTLQLSKKHVRKGLLGSIPEYEATEDPKNNPPRFASQVPIFHTLRCLAVRYINVSFAMVMSDFIFCYCSVLLHFTCLLKLSYCISTLISVVLIAIEHQIILLFRRY